MFNADAKEAPGRCVSANRPGSAEREVAVEFLAALHLQAALALAATSAGPRTISSSPWRKERSTSIRAASG